MNGRDRAAFLAKQEQMRQGRMAQQNTGRVLNDDPTGESDLQRSRRERGQMDGNGNLGANRPIGVSFFGNLFRGTPPHPFSYGAKANDGRESWESPEAAASNEYNAARTQETYMMAMRVLDPIKNEITNRYGNFGKVIEDAMDAFKHPCGLKHPDKVFQRFIDDLKIKNHIYCYNIAPFIHMYAVQLFAEYALETNQRISIEKLHKEVFHITIRVLLAEFGNWLMSVDGGAYLYHDMSEHAKSKIIPPQGSERSQRDEDIIFLNNTILDIGGRVGDHCPISVPWEMDLISKIQQKAYGSSRVVDDYFRGTDTYCVTVDPYEPVRRYEKPVVSSTSDYQVHTPRQNNDEYVRNFCKELFDVLDGNGSPSVYAEQPASNANQFNFASNWGPDTLLSTDDKVQPAPVEERQEPQQKSLTLEEMTRNNLHRVEFRKWFMPIPGMDNMYVIEPYPFHMFSKFLKNIGKNEDYCDGVRFLANRLPVVELDWDAGTYKYSLVKVKDNEDMGMKLSNPALIIPLLESRSEEEVLEEYRADVATLEELEAKRALEANDPNAVKEMVNVPKIIYANKPVAFNRRAGMNSCVNALNTSVIKKFGEEADVVALPFIDCADFDIDNVTMKEIKELLPYMVSGNEFELTFEEFIKETMVRFEDKIRHTEYKYEWRCVQRYVSEHFCTVINRWLVEERYYGPTRRDKNFLAVKNLHEGGIDLLEDLKQNDRITYRILENLPKCRTLVEQLQPFASEEIMEAFASAHSTANVDESIRDEYKQDIIDTTVVVATSGVLLRINNATPLDDDGPKVFERSSSPEMLHLIETAPAKVAKHFKRHVGVFITFGRDINKTIWVATLSGDSPDKVMLVPVRNVDSLALRKTVISEITFEQPSVSQ